MKNKLSRLATAASLCTLSSLSSLVAEEVVDKSGTNPINFTFDARLYNEYQWLNTEGDGWQNVSTFEFRAPILDGKFQFRTRLRGVGIEADFNDDGTNDIDLWEFGDMDIRVLTVPYLNMEKKFAFAVGLEAFIPTANNDLISSNAFALGPQGFAVFFAPFGGLFDLIAPAYQHKFSVYEEDGANEINQGLFDVFALKTFDNKKKWIMINPQAVLDYENNIEFALFEVELGMMIDDYLGTSGHSMYLRPSAGFGPDRPYDYSVELGYKIVW